MNMTKLKIPFNVPQITHADEMAVLSSLRSGRLSGDGPFGREAEELLSEIHGGASSLITTSATHALEMSALLLDLKPGDEVIVPAFTFVSTALAFFTHGARPVFVDVRADTLNIDEELIEAAISPRTRAICVVNYGGVGVNFEAILAICERFELALIEDNSHGLGGTSRGQRLGTFGVMSAVSFHETKNITSGEGGALICNDPELVSRAQIFRDKGTNRRQFFNGEVDKYTWVGPGSSWVQSEILASLLRSQLGRLEAVNNERRKIWDLYSEGLSDSAIRAGARLQQTEPAAGHTAHLFYIILPESIERAEFLAELVRRGIGATSHYQSLPNSHFARSHNLSHPDEVFPVSDWASEKLVRLPIYAGLSPENVRAVMSGVKDALVGRSS